MTRRLPLTQPLDQSGRRADGHDSAEILLPTLLLHPPPPPPPKPCPASPPRPLPTALLFLAGSCHEQFRYGQGRFCMMSVQHFRCRPRCHPRSRVPRRMVSVEQLTRRVASPAYTVGDSCARFLWGSSCLWGIPEEDSYGRVPVYGGFLRRIPMGEFLSMGHSCGGFLWGSSCLWGIPVEDSYGGVPVYGAFLWRIPM